MSTFLIRSATSLSMSNPVVLLRLSGPHSRPNALLNLWKYPRPCDNWSDMLTTQPMNGRNSWNDRVNGIRGEGWGAKIIGQM